MKSIRILLFSIVLASCTATMKPVMVDGRPFQPHAGVIIPGDLANLPPVSDEGISRIGVLVKEENGISVFHAGTTVIPNRDLYDMPECFPHGRLAAAFVQRINAIPGYMAIDISPEADDGDEYTRSNFWYGYKEFDDSDAAGAFRERLLQEFKLDAALFITEDMERPYILGNGASIGDHKAVNVEGYGGKGITTQRKAKNYLFASFKTELIDLRTGKQTRHGSYRQGSMWRMGEIDWELPWEDRSSEFITELCDDLRVLDENNIAYALWRLRIALSDEPPSPLSHR